MKNNNISLEQIIQNNEILSVWTQDISKFARVKNVWELIKLATWQKIDWIDNNKVVNNETILLARYILKKIIDTLWYDPYEIKDKNIFWITLKIWEEISKIENIESYIVGTYIKKVAFQVKNIHLRYERLLRQKENTLLEKDNNKDHLTWLLNRRAIELYLENAIENKKRSNDNYWIIILDIDFFKKINDNYGHNTWDLVLQEIWTELRNFFRTEDKICRWWWEEFLIIMKWWNSNIYIKKLEKLRIYIEQNLIQIINKKIISYSWKFEDSLKEDKITISIWITSLNNSDNPKSCVKRADDWLYIAKEGWRNKIIYIDNKENNII